MTVKDSSSLDLKTGMTIEAWVYVDQVRRPGAASRSRRPTAASRTGSTPRRSAASRAATPARRPRAGRPAPSSALRRWTHLAVTYDGSAIRTYVNGRLAGTHAQTGPLVTSSQPLHFGGNAVWPEWFAGRLDEIRIYDRALTPAQLQTDMTKAVAGPTKAGTAKAQSGATVKQFRGRHPHSG